MYGGGGVNEMIINNKILLNDRRFLNLQSYPNTGCWSFVYIDPSTVHSLRSFEMWVSNVLPVQNEGGTYHPSYFLPSRGCLGPTLDDI